MSTSIQLSVDEEEHSGEMQYPFIRHILNLAGHQGDDVTVLPIMVGSISPSMECEFAAFLAPILQAPDTFFVVSSDFCHWGSRFDFNPYDNSKGKIHQVSQTN